MEPNDIYKLYMQGDGDDVPQKEPPPPPPSKPPTPPPEPDRHDHTRDSPLPDAVEPDKDWDRK